MKRTKGILLQVAALWGSESFILAGVSSDSIIMAIALGGILTPLAIAATVILAGQYKEAQEEEPEHGKSVCV